MKYTFCTAVIILLLFTGCGKNTVLNPSDVPPDTPSSVNFGTDQTLDVVTWNILNFPRPETNIPVLAEVISALHVDIIAFQEISNSQAFYTMAASIPNYSALVSTINTNDTNLGYLYDTRTVTVNSSYPIYTSESNPFPRRPYVLDVTWQNQQYYIINNHLKAYDDNVIDLTDAWDNETRRLLACQKLDQYVTTNLPDKKVVILGDMNDQIQDPPEYNVFMTFINKPLEYLFADMPLALNPIDINFSYPSYRSNLDHILISNELFDDFTAGGSYCRAILAEIWLGGWIYYKTAISDHRPVGIRLASPNTKNKP
ncbi:MAG: endonuclease/exonuclease/phosphatase family protein [Candidatus Cloacimonetes bacterium]|nr:endonuclease/exonuclease/phosphatase family protein [Candidatus Cloacimonadota bacterium]